MTRESDSRRAGQRLLAERLAATPALVRATLAGPAPLLPWHPGRVRRVVATGVGASAAHARLLVALLEEAGLAARFAPLTSFTAPPPEDASADAIVVFSQGLSPNARLALARPERWAAVLVVTAVPATPAQRGEPGDAAAPPSGELGERQAALDAVVARGGGVYRVPAAEEYGTLLRVSGPLVGAAAAIVLARTIVRGAGGTTAGLLAVDGASADDARAAIDAAITGAEREHAALDARALGAGCGVLASGTYGEVLGNVQATVQEGLLVPAPPVWDLLGFAHGPFQEVVMRDATLLALTRAGAPGEAALLDRLETMLVPGRHRLARLNATLPGALALLEHQALVAALVLRAIEERNIDQVEFPGRGADRVLYDVTSLASDPAPRAPAPRAAMAAHGAVTARPAVTGYGAAPARPAPPAGPAVAVRLADLAWPDVAALRAAGCTTAILPLGSTEQHGPHLPFATDTLIADAVGGRVAERLGGALCLPAVPLGCADEHLGFPGTLSITDATLVAILRDTGRALARHGFARLLVFTAHGGNYGALRASAERLARELEPLHIEAFLDSASLTAHLEAVAQAYGVAPGEAGQHAGELETSVLLALAPGLVRRARLASGLVDPAIPSGELFYPDLRRHAADGTVGDPRRATAERATAYLDAWADVLVASWSAPDAK